MSYTQSPTTFVQSGTAVAVPHNTVTTITFPTAFTVAPHVAVDLTGEKLEDVLQLEVTTVTTTTFDVRFRLVAGAARDISWIAHGAV